jgi:hypothetical protein
MKKYYRQCRLIGSIKEITLIEVLKKLKSTFENPRLVIENTNEDLKTTNGFANYWMELE